MDERLLKAYEQELRHLRETAREFGRAYPQRAAALGLELEPADPYIERLLDATAFMAARVRLQLDARFPEFTQSLIEGVFPDFLNPVPSFALLRLQPDIRGVPPGGQLVKSGSRVRAERADLAGRSDQSATACVFTTAYDVRLLPIEISKADLPVTRLPETGANVEFGDAKAALRVRLRRVPAVPWSAIQLDTLRLYFSAGDGLGYEVLEQVLAHQIGLIIRDCPGNDEPSVQVFCRKGAFARRSGFDPSEALLPVDPRVFQGYRLLREYFAMPERFLFVEISFLKIPGFAEALAACKGEELEVILPLKQASGRLEREFNEKRVHLFCVPAANLFRKRFSQVIEPGRFSEFHLVPDINRSLDFEIHSLVRVEGYTDGSPDPTVFEPFFRCRHGTSASSAYYSLARHLRVPGAAEADVGAEAQYLGGECYISLVDRSQVPFRRNLRTLLIEARCTNRYLPIDLIGRTAKWTLEGGVKAAVEALAGPSRPSFTPVDGDRAWRLLNLFSLNYLSLADDPTTGAASLRELLYLHCDPQRDGMMQQIRSLRHVSTKPVVAPLPPAAGQEASEGVAALVRGLRVTVDFEELAIRDRSIFLLGAVLDEFFARYVSLNSFTETVIRLWPDDRVWMRWPNRLGSRPAL